MIKYGKIWTVKEGMVLYDESCGRYLEVVRVYPREHTAECRTYEVNEDGEEVEEVEDGLFTLSELTHYKEA